MNYTLQKGMGITSSAINLESSAQVLQSYQRKEHEKTGYKAQEKTREVTCCSSMKYQDVI
jgi:hypothetical protein